MRKVLALAALLPACVVPYAGPGDPYARPPPPAPARPPAYAPPPAYPPAPPPPAAAPPAQRRLTRDEAVQLAWRYAQQRGLQPSDVREVEREEGRWEVKLNLAGGGRAKVVVDAWSGAELKFQVKEGGERRHRERHEDDDD